MNEIIDFSEVVLRNEELACLYALRKAGSVAIIEPPYSSYMSALGFISISPKFSDKQHFILAENGERYLKYLDDKKRKEAEEAREKKKLIHEENFREWTGIFISSLLSIVSIIIAVFAR